MSEAYLQTHVCKLLTAYARPEVCWWACPNGEQRSAKTGQRLKQQGVKAGAPDLMFVVGGGFYGLELKTEVGLMSPKQHVFREDLMRAGGTYHVARGLEQAIARLIEMGVFRPNIHINVTGLLNERK
jgi:elongation factor P hydroxylase